jgi:Acyl-CoA dehydrogenase, C-terminal domain
MDFAPSARTEELGGQLADFVRERVDPAEAVYTEQVAASGDPHFHPPVMEDLKAEARGGRFEIAAIKVVAARLATTVIDRAIQAFGAAGVSHDWPLASMYTHARTLHLVDGPDEVHLLQIARREPRGYESFRTT